MHLSFRALSPSSDRDHHNFFISQTLVVVKKNRIQSNEKKSSILKHKITLNIKIFLTIKMSNITEVIYSCLHALCIVWKHS